MKLIRTAAFALVLGVSLAAAQDASPPESLKIHFGSGQATISEDQRKVLDQAARLFREGSPLVMIVAGSSDTVGSGELNLSLSIRRAQTVALGLADRGIPIERLQVLGRGVSQLEVPTSEGVANADNRLVTITWK